MANRNRSTVHIKVDKNYFDKCFEPERIKLQNRIGINFSQANFTAYLAASGAKIKYQKMSKKFAPKKVRNGGFRFNL